MARRKNKKNGDEKRRKLLGILLALFAVLLLVSLVTHSRWDDRVFTDSSNPLSIDYRNQVGIVGAITSYYFFFFFGWLSIFIPFMIGLLSVRLLDYKWRTIVKPGFWITFICSTLITMITNVYKIPTLDLTIGAPGANGGYIFYHVTNLFMKIVGKTGSVILFGAGIVASLVWLSYAYPWVSKMIGVNFKFKFGGFGKLFGKIGASMKKLFTPTPKEFEIDEDEYDNGPAAVEPKPERRPKPSDSREPEAVEPVKQPAGVSPKKTLKIEKRPSLVGRMTNDFVFPGTDLLVDDPDTSPTVSAEELRQTAEDLRQTLLTFNVKVDGDIITKPGPVITRFEFKPAAGIKVNQIVNLSDDLALALKAKRIRIVAPIPGKAAVGVEIPNRNPRIVYLKDIITANDFSNDKLELPLALGKTIAGRPFVTDLAKMPHLLVAGATNSGKSVCVNTMITSLIYRIHPKELKLILIDPKMLELSVYAGIPHLGRPVITNPKRAEKVLSDAVTEMQTRYEKLAKAGVRNIVDYNKGLDKDDEKMPYIVIIVDELADMMMASGSSQIEEKITRLAQMARAVGIHLILATQRPSVDVITGLIKANFPARIAFHVASRTDSRTILDANGAEKLLGNGDMLFMQPGQAEAVRLHGALITGQETQGMVKFILDQFPDETKPAEANKTAEGATEFEDIDLDDPLFIEAVKTVITNQQGSVSLLQRKLGIGYQRAARLIDQLEEAGVVESYSGSKAREVLVDEKFIDKLMAARSLTDSN